MYVGVKRNNGMRATRSALQMFVELRAALQNTQDIRRGESESITRLRERRGER